MRTKRPIPTLSMFVMTACLLIGCGSGGGSGSGGTGTGSNPANTPTPTPTPIPTPMPTPNPGGNQAGQIGNGAPLIMAAPTAPANLFVSPTGSDTNPGTQAQPLQTLQVAFDRLLPGDVLEVLDGTYSVSSNTLLNAQGTANLPIIIRSTSGNATIDGSGMNGSFSSRDAIFLENAEHILIHGLKIRNAPRAGMRISGGQFITIQAVNSGNNGVWGIFTDYVDDLNLLGNECFGSAVEHGIYFSNSADRVVMRGNYCHDNNASGLQINADPVLPGDGITTDALIEDNVLARNGAGGGAAINLASLRDSVIRNNLCYDNQASGIVLWDDGFSSNFGSKNNLIIHNTVVFRSGEGRHCIVMRNGSTGNRIENNILVGGRRGCFEITTDSLSGFSTDSNVLFSIDGWPIATDDSSGATYNFSAWAQLHGGSALSMNQNPVFLDPGNNDFGLISISPGKNMGKALGLSDDLLGDLRSTNNPDIGAIER